MADDLVADRCNPSLQVPLVNMARLVNGGESRDEELKKLYLACRQWGAFQIMSNGIYKALEHRAVVNESKVRTSIICFCYPEENATIEPVQDIVKPDCPAMYKSISQPEYFRSYLDEKLESKQQFIDTLKVHGPHGFSQNCT
ncbi:hypothetical protein AAC387_Pa11g0614 [Persea americana]